MSLTILPAIYNTNKDFKEYVDRYAKNYMEGHSISVEEALTHQLVADVAEYYILLEEQNNEKRN